jgi:type VI secretion system VgrG family protein
MPNQSQQRVYVNFTSDEFDNIASDLFQVTGFDGVEAISELFRFEIDLLSTDADIDLESLVGKHASLAITKDGEQRDFHGVIASLEQDAEAQFDHYCYKAVLVPRLWLMSLSKQNQIYQDKTVPEIVQQEILHGDFCGGILADDIDDRMAQTYPVREYTVQYRESDLDFISRLMENEGIYYYFEHLDGQDKLVFCDHNSKLDKVLDENIVSYVPKSGLASFDQQAIHRFKVKQAQVCKEIVLKDYNYREPHLPMVGTAETGDLGYGRQYAYGDHFKSAKDGNNLAHLRAQLELCKQRTCVGTSDALFFQAGKLIQVEDHYRASLNKEYLITRIRHMGGQALPGVSALGAGEAVDYQNEFDAIPSEIEFRPSLTTPKPKLYGFMSAIVDGALTSDRAQIDEHGRYKLIMPFDVSGSGDGKASRWVRKAEPFGGQGTGMSFPLLKGAEVIWSCMDGDLDRPIITGVVPGTGQGANKSVVTAQNSTDNVIKTPSGIVVQMRDGKGAPPPEDQEGTEQSQTRIPDEASVGNTTSSHYMASKDNTVPLIQQQQHIVRGVFTSIPDTDANSDSTYSYQAMVTGFGEVRYSLTGPAGMSIDENTGEVQWVTVQGSYSVTIKATLVHNKTLAKKYFIEQRFTLDITDPAAPRAPNLNMYFASVPSQNVKTGVGYEYKTQVLRGIGELTYSLTASPSASGLDIDSAGLVRWSVAGAVDDYVITVNATDTNGQTDSQIFTLKVLDSLVEDLDFTSIPTLTVEEDLSYTYRPQAKGGKGNKTYTFSTVPTADPIVLPVVSGLTFDNARGLITGTPDTAGEYEIAVIVRDQSAPQLEDTQTFTLKVLEVVEEAEDFVGVKGGDDNDGIDSNNQKSYSVHLPKYRQTASGTGGEMESDGTQKGNQHSYSRIGAFHVDEETLFGDNVYYRKDKGGTKVSPLECESFEDASNGGENGQHRIMDVLNATKVVYSIEPSNKSSAGFFEYDEPARFGLMEYTDGAKLMIHQNGCFDLAAGTSVTYDSLGSDDSLISVVLGQDPDEAEGNAAKMVQSERFHQSGGKWITETWGNVNAYDFTLGQQHSINIGATFDYKLAYAFEASVGGAVECSLATKTSFCAGVNAEVKLAGDINFSNGIEFNYSTSDSVDISGAGNEIKGDHVLLQYEPALVTKPAGFAFTAGMAAAAAAVGTSIAAVGVGTAGFGNPGKVKDNTDICLVGAVAVNAAALAINAAGITAYFKNRLATKASTVSLKKFALQPYVKIDKDSIVLHAGAASIELKSTGEIKIIGKSVLATTDLVSFGQKTGSHMFIGNNAVLRTNTGNVQIESMLKEAKIRGKTKTSLGLKGVDVNTGSLVNIT